MKKIAKEFFHRGLVSCGIGPLVLATVYLVMQHTGTVEALTVAEVCIGIFSLTALAFVAGGMNVIYQIERLPLMLAILIHGGILYVGYLVTYLVNGWLEQDTAPIMIFTGIFAVGYLLIWAFIYSATKRSTDRINQMLKKNQQHKK